MRYMFAIVLAVAYAGSAMAASTPTSDQCKTGYKPDYAKMWSKDQFNKACAGLKTTGKK